MIVFLLYVTVLLGLAWPLGAYMARVFSGEKTPLDRLFRPLERAVYRLGGIDETKETDWKTYSLQLVAFNIAGALAVYILQIMQQYLPLNPEQLANVAPWHLALNTAISFMTNTNWQAYGGESIMSYSTQMLALTVQNFLSAATGLAVAVALIRGLVRKSTNRIGNYWVDMTRSVVRILLPLSILFSIVLVEQGVLQNLSPYVTVRTLEGARQTLAMGPVASQEAIKMLGTNGGGFFNANSSHPFENPTALTNFLQMISTFLIPAATAFMFGRMTENRRQGYAILSAMLLLFILMFTGIYTSERNGNPLVQELGISGFSSMEGKEVRFGIGGSSLFATVTTGASCGAVNAMHDSLTPLGGLFPMLQMMLGEVVFGGVGAGFYGIMLYVFITVFIVGLMVGRTPEYLGKKIEAGEMKMASLAILIPSAVILLGAAVAVMTEAGRAGILNDGPHGLSEVLYGFSSAAANNGSAFAGLTVNTAFYDILLGLAMLIGRFGVILPVLAMAGSMAEKKTSPAGPGTFSTTGSLFVILLSGVVLIVGALTFLPSLALGPVIEHLLLYGGSAF